MPDSRARRKPPLRVAAQQAAEAILSAPPGSPLALAAKARVMVRDVCSTICGTEEFRSIVAMVDQTHRFAGEPAFRLGVSAWEYAETLIAMGFSFRSKAGQMEEWWPDEVSPLMRQAYDGLQLRAAHNGPEFHDRLQARLAGYADD